MFGQGKTARLFVSIALMLTPLFAADNQPLDLFQCASVKQTTLLVSDRYEGAVQYGNRLILSNALGFIVRDINNPEGEPLHLEPLPGQVSDIFIQGDELLVSVIQQGVYRYRLDPNQAAPRRIQFRPVSTLQGAAIDGNNLFEIAENNVRHLTLNPFEVRGNLPIRARKVLARNGLLYIQTEDNKLLVQAYVNQQLQGEPKPFSLDGDQLFYDFGISGDRLVLDTFNGVKWARLDNQLAVAESGFYFQNQGRDLVLGFTVSDDRLALSFVDRLEILSIGNQNQLTPLGTIAQTFQDVGITRLALLDDYIYLLNQARLGRVWSLAAVPVEGNSLGAVNRLPALFREFTGAAAAQGIVFFASDRNLTRLDEDNQLVDVTEFGQSIQSLTASNDLLLVTFRDEDTTKTNLSVFRVDTEANLAEIYSDQLTGSIQGLTQFGGRFGFVQFFRTTSSDNYNHFLLDVSDTGNERVLLQDVITPIDDGNPVEFFQVIETGTLYKRGNQVFLQPTDGEQQSYALPIASFPILDLAARDNQLWLESEDGIYLLEVVEDALETLALYENYHDLERMSNNLIIAVDDARGPSNVQLLSKAGDVVFSRIAFSTSTTPSLIAQVGDRCIVAEPTSVSSFELFCPNQDNTYLLPVDPRFELEINTDVAPNNLISLYIYNDQGKLLGMQNLTAEALAGLNGSLLSDWIFDYNRFYQASAAVLRSGQPISPIISGTPGIALQGRFAYRVPKQRGGIQYAPHIPRDTNSWQTSVWVTNMSAQNEVDFSVFSNEQEVRPFNASFGETRRLVVSDNFFENPSPYAGLVSDTLGAMLGGFELIQVNGQDRAAAAPLAGTLWRENMIPFLAGKNSPNRWTGMVLMNPYESQIQVRAVGYDGNGDISYDRLLAIPAQDTIVVNAEQWIASYDPNADVNWFFLLAESPIAGLAFYATYEETQLAAIPLIGETGRSLTFSGIRQNVDYTTQLVLTNRDLTPTDVVYSAYSASGALLGVTEDILDRRRSVELRVETLFPQLSDRLDEIQTIRVDSENEMGGFAFRILRGTNSLESISALVNQ